MDQRELSRDQAAQTTGLTLAQTKQLNKSLCDLLVEYGACEVLGHLGELLRHVEAGGNAAAVGNTIKALAEVEW